MLEVKVYAFEDSLMPRLKCLLNWEHKTGKETFYVKSISHRKINEYPRRQLTSLQSQFPPELSSQWIMYYVSQRNPSPGDYTGESPQRPRFRADKCSLLSTRHFPTFTMTDWCVRRTLELVLWSFERCLPVINCYADTVRDPGIFVDHIERG